MSIAICGSIAYDTIMNFEGRFADHILPDKVHMLNVSFLAPRMQRNPGGCAGNIAYGLKQLGGDPRIIATVGQDGGPYLQRLQSLGIDIRGIRQIEDAYTAQAFITTDLANNQITAFHPGAMMFSQTVAVTTTGPVQLGIVAPDSKEGMWTHAMQLRDAGVPFVFDPGQALPLFSGDELIELISMADWLAVNDYEGQLIEDKTQHTLLQHAEHLRGVIQTCGDAGAILMQHAEAVNVSAVSATNVVDPTGCGDAFRAGLLFGLSQGWSLQAASRVGCAMGAIKIAHHGGQNYQTDWKSVSTLVHQQYGDAALT
jgi:adenosine kinase